MVRELSPKAVAIGPLMCGGGQPFVLIAGPCVVEDRDSALRHAQGAQDSDRPSRHSIYL